MRTVPIAPHKLLDTLIERMKLKNDAALARQLEFAAPVISKLRNRTLPLGATHVLRIHDATGMAISEIRELEAA